MYTPRVRINKKIYRSIPRSNEVKAKFYLSSSLLTLYHHHIINTHKNSYRYTTHHQPKMILCVCRTIKVHFHICRKKKWYTHDPLSQNLHFRMWAEGKNLLHTWRDVHIFKSQYVNNQYLTKMQQDLNHGKICVCMHKTWKFFMFEINELIARDMQLHLLTSSCIVCVWQCI